MADLVTVYAAIGHGNRGKAHGRGRLIGCSEARGSQANYHNASGRGLGYSELQGREIILRENGGCARLWRSGISNPCQRINPEHSSPPLPSRGTGVLRPVPVR